MKKVHQWVSIIVIVFLIISLAPSNSDDSALNSMENKIILENGMIPQKESDEEIEEPVNKLQWTSPNGELPGTYREYLKTHPYTPPSFSVPIEQRNTVQSLRYNLSILVDNGLYSKINVDLGQYLDDLDAEGYSVFVQTINGGSPLEIKNWINTRYNKGSGGVILIGDITAAWVEVSGSVFPSDLFYMDLDGTWEDTDNDGDYDTHSSGNGDMGPELYVGRINAHTLTYDTEANLVNDYLKKNHAYRNGELQQPWKGLEYVDEDWYTMPVNLDNIYEENLTRYDQGYYTTGPDYLKEMDESHHFVTVCAHSYSGGHHFGTRPTESVAYTHIYVYSPITRSGKLLLGSDDGIMVWLNNELVYTNDRYGNWHKDYYTVDITLKAGWNQLLCKVSQSGGDFKISARFTDQDFNTFDDLVFQMNNPDSYGQEAQYIRSWLLNGFHQDSSERFWEYITTNYLDMNEDTIFPHENDVNGGKTWGIYNSGYPYINLGDHCDDKDFGVCYAFTRIISENTQFCQLRMGYDDGARAWLNGNLVIDDNRYGDLETDMTKVNVTLKGGENRLLVKVSEWMGDHGFTARLCHPDGSLVDGLTYDPPMAPASWIGTWLVNGPYSNPDKDTRLTTDYLVNEGSVIPNNGDAAPLGVWEQYIGDGCPVNLDTFYDHGSWVLSNDIQNRDPPILFYNLFACGPGRFTDENYLAGSYIFNTNSGLITVASAKSGSMLNFGDFTQPLSEGKSIGEAFYEWFDAQAPFQKWEQEWYYGMVICGDPTLRVSPFVGIDISKPGKNIYFNNNKILPFFTPVIFGDIDVVMTPYNLDDIERVEVYIDDTLMANFSSSPFVWHWNEKTPFKIRYTISVYAYTTSGNYVTDSLPVWRFF